jgi:hypothetical protein
MQLPLQSHRRIKSSTKELDIKGGEYSHMDDDRIEHIFNYMEWDHLTERQLEMIISFEKQFTQFRRLSPRQIETLEDIFKQAAEKA